MCFAPQHMISFFLNNLHTFCLFKLNFVCCCTFPHSKISIHFCNEYVCYVSVFFFSQIFIIRNFGSNCMQTFATNTFTLHANTPNNTLKKENIRNIMQCTHLHLYGGAYYFYWEERENIRMFTTRIFKTHENGRKNLRVVYVISNMLEYFLCSMIVCNSFW